MSYSNINKSTNFFNTITFTGNGSQPRAITGVGHQPDFVWLKDRDTSYNHQLYDSVRSTSAGVLYSNASDAADSAYQMSSFDSDGFTLGSNLGAVNENNKKIVSWNWKAGNSNTAVSASGSGNNCYNACTHRANTTSGFSIVKYTGRNTEISNGQHTRVTHGLGVKPDFIIIKGTDNREWIVCKGDDNDANMHLNKNHQVSGSEYIGNQNLNTSTYFNVGNDSHVNENGVEYIAYLFSNKTGYCHTGTYEGTNNSDGPMILTGMAPKFIMLKNMDHTKDWNIWDATRDTYNPLQKKLAPSSNGVESTDLALDFLSNGFKLRQNGSNFNDSYTYLYLAFGQPLVGSNNIPCTAR